MVKPILFNTDMVRAIQNGTKAMMRRVVKEPYYIDDEGSSRVSGLAIHRGTNMTDGMPYPDSPYRPGDILYVRETWRPFSAWSGSYTGCEIEYKAGGIQRFNEVIALPIAKGEWRPSIHMPREAARIFLRVTDVRVERLQDPFFKHGSTIFSLREEGVDIGDHCRECIETYGSPCCIDSESECGVLDEVRGDFSVLWNRTIKPADLAKYSWGVNPWVWVIEFERCEKPKEG